MADQSPAKKLKTVQGNICNVSPLKDKHKPYFEAILQHESERSKVMAFRPQDHMHFQNAEKTGSQVTLQNVVVSPSKSNGTRNVFYTHKSNMSCVRDLRHAFGKTRPAEAHDVKLSELLKLDLKRGFRKRVNINVKIIVEECKGNNAMPDGHYLPKTVYTVADSTGYISLTVWREENITAGEWYKFTNVSVTQFKGKTNLSSTRQTKILNIPSQGSAVAVEVPTKSMKCEIIGVKMTQIFICLQKHILKDFIPSNPSVYCPSCKTHYKTTAVIMKISGRLDLKPEMGDIIKAGVEDEVIRSAVSVKPDASANDIIQALMSLPPMQLTICKDVIVKMEKPTSQNNNAPQTSHAVMEPEEDPIDFNSPPDLGFFSPRSKKRKSTN